MELRMEPRMEPYGDRASEACVIVCQRGGQQCGLDGNCREEAGARKCQVSFLSDSDIARVKQMRVESALIFLWIMTST